MHDASDGAIEDVDIAGMQEYLDSTDVVFAVLFGSHATRTADGTSDVDIALRFPDEMADIERFRRRNRIDAELQQYAAGFVDVSDLEELPVHVAHAALQNGIVVAGEMSTAYRDGVKQEYEATAGERAAQREELIERLASGDM